MFDKKTNRKKIDASYHFFVWVSELYCVILKKNYHLLFPSKFELFELNNHLQQTEENAELWAVIDLGLLRRRMTMSQATQQRGWKAVTGELRVDPLNMFKNSERNSYPRSASLILLYFPRRMCLAY